MGLVRSQKLEVETLRLKKIFLSRQGFEQCFWVEGRKAQNNRQGYCRLDSLVHQAPYSLFCTSTSPLTHQKFDISFTVKKFHGSGQLPTSHRLHTSSPDQRWASYLYLLHLAKFGQLRRRESFPAVSMVIFTALLSHHQYCTVNHQRLTKTQVIIKCAVQGRLVR